jgi:hypothetical protein
MTSDEDLRSDQDTHNLQPWSNGKMTRRRAIGFLAGEALGAALLLGFGIPKPEGVGGNVEQTNSTESDITEINTTESDVTEYATSNGGSGGSNGGCTGDCSPVPPGGGGNRSSSPPTKVVATTHIDTRLL